MKKGEWKEGRKVAKKEVKKKGKKPRKREKWKNTGKNTASHCLKVRDHPNNLDSEISLNVSNDFSRNSFFI